MKLNKARIRSTVSVVPNQSHFLIDLCHAFYLKTVAGDWPNDTVRKGRHVDIPEASLLAKPKEMLSVCHPLHDRIIFYPTDRTRLLNYNPTRPRTRIRRHQLHHILLSIGPMKEDRFPVRREPNVIDVLGDIVVR